MRDSIEEPIQKALLDEQIGGLAFLEVGGGMWAIHNTAMRQTLKRRFNSFAEARQFTMERLVSPQRKKGGAK